MGRRQPGLAAVATGALAAVALAMSGCGIGGPVAAAGSGLIEAVGAESQYANVLSQIGGRYVYVSALLSNPNTDPHSFEASPRVAQEIGLARLVVQNGVGYDSWINTIESAAPNPARKVIVAQQLLGLPDSTPNPHLWYDPKTMPAVANRIAADLADIQPAHRAYFEANVRKFDASMNQLLDVIARFKAAHRGVTAATTEPVADYLLTAMGIDNLTPFRFQADIMNGVDPSPEDIAFVNGLFRQHKVRLFAYNQQVVDSLTESIRQNAISAGVPVVGVYETMPAPGYDYQSWMLAEVTAIEKAVTSKMSTQRL